MNKLLNTRQWKLYNYIKFKTSQGCWTDKQDIADNVDGYTIQTTTNATSVIKNCPAIYQDIKAINNSNEIEKIIVVDKNKIFLGNEEYCKEYAEKLKDKALKLLKRSWQLSHKINSDGQGKLVSCQGNVIDKQSKAREFVESFVEGVEL